jgi:hypothetical protein
MMNSKMGAATLNKFKVAGLVVEPVVVAVVDNLLGSETATDHSLHDEAMLHHPPGGRRVRMVGPVNESVDGAAKFAVPSRSNLGYFPTLAKFGSKNTKALLTQRLSGLMRPTMNRRGAASARKQVRRLHADSIARGKGGRYSDKQQAEWVTMNRAPVHVPPNQATLFPRTTP